MDTKTETVEPRAKTLVDGGMCGRRSAKGVLEDRIRITEQHLKELRTVHAMLPTEMTPEQDNAVYHLIASSSRW